MPPALAGPCGRCRRERTPFERGASLGPYQGALRIAIHELKYHGRRRVAARLAEALCSEATVRSLLTSPAILVPVPLHPKRRRQRGFNQAELLARELALRSGLLANCHDLVRSKPTNAQTGLSAAARRRNVAAAFVVGRRNEIRDAQIVLVDDVYTTGATARSCAQALRLAGAKVVDILTVARVV